jgi:hypothetical protein
MDAALKSHLESLLAILDEELNLLNELNELLRNKTEALARSDIEALKNILQAEEEAVGRLNERESKRAAITGRLALHFSLAPEECRLKALLERIEDEETRRGICDMRQRMKAAVRRVSSQSRKAEALASQNAGYAEFMINLFLGAGPGSGRELYDAKGRLTDGNKDGGLLDYTV